jgi:phage terminase small subunit
MCEARATPMSKLDGLRPKQRRFVEEYLADLNATQAAIRAGYSPKTAGQQAWDLLKKPEIEVAIAELQQARSQRCQITADMVLAELARLAFANMMDYMRIGDGGDPYVDLSALTRDRAAGLVQFVVEDFKDGRGEEARDVRKVRIKLHPKLPALIKLGEHLGLFKGQGEEKPNAEEHPAYLLAKDDPVRQDVLRRMGIEPGRKELPAPEKA